LIFFNWSKRKKKNFLKFHKSWPASQCLLNNSTCVQSKVNPYFTIFGLLPSQINQNISRPQCCETFQKFEMRKISKIRHIHFFWNDVTLSTSELWRSQWMTSGSCISLSVDSMNTSEKYFQSTMKMYQDLNLIDALLTNGVFPISSELVNSSLIGDIFGKKFQSVPDLKCKYSSHLKSFVLIQVLFCLTKDLKLMKECPTNQDEFKCPPKFIIPEPTHIEGFDSF
jgi:ribonuclease I